MLNLNLKTFQEMMILRIFRLNLRLCLKLMARSLYFWQII